MSDRKRTEIPATEGSEQPEFSKPRTRVQGAESLSVELARALPDGDGVPVTPSGHVIPGISLIRPAAEECLIPFETEAAHKPAVCHGPWLVVKTNAESGKKEIWWPQLHTHMVDAAAAWEDAPELAADHLITLRKREEN